MKNQLIKLLSALLTIIMLFVSCTSAWTLAEDSGTGDVPTVTESGHEIIVDTTTVDIDDVSADITGNDSTDTDSNDSADVTDDNSTDDTSYDSSDTTVDDSVGDTGNDFADVTNDNSTDDTGDGSSDTTIDDSVGNTSDNSSDATDDDSADNTSDSSSDAIDDDSTDDADDGSADVTGDSSAEDAGNDSGSNTGDDNTVIVGDYFAEEAGNFVLMSVPPVDIIDGNTCEHADMTTNYFFEENKAVQYDATNHRLIGKLTQYNECNDCDYHETLEYNTAASILEAHSFDEGFECTACGYKTGFTSCTHPNTFQEAYHDEPEVTDYTISQHYTEYTEYTIEICSICEETVSESSGTKRAAWENHEYYEGDDCCWICGYESNCSHQNLKQNTRVSTDKDSLLETYYFLNSEDNSTHLVYTIEAKETYHSCTDCGSVVMLEDENYFMDLTKTTEAHKYGSDNTCVCCGYKKTDLEEPLPPCSHTNYIVIDTIKNKYSISLNDKKHAYMQHIYEYATCNDCSATFVLAEYTERYSTQEHSLSNNYYSHVAACTKCEYQRKLSAEEVRTALNTSRKNMINYLPTPDVFDSLNIKYIVFLNARTGAASFGHSGILFIDHNGNGFYQAVYAGGKNVLITDANFHAKYLTPTEIKTLLGKPDKGNEKNANSVVNPVGKLGVDKDGNPKKDPGYTRWIARECNDTYPATARFNLALGLMIQPGNYELFTRNCDDIALSIYTTEEEYSNLLFDEGGNITPNGSFDGLVFNQNYDYNYMADRDLLWLYP